MVVKVKWFYHPEETKGLGKRLTEPRVSRKNLIFNRNNSIIIIYVFILA